MMVFAAGPSSMAQHPPATAPVSASDIDGDDGPVATRPAEAGSDDDPLGVFRAPLLREGSVIVNAKATFAPARAARDDRDNDDGSERAAASKAAGGAATLKLVIESGPAYAAPHELILLPCTRLTEMERLAESGGPMPGGAAAFLVSGQIFAYRNRNYVLVTHAPLVARTHDDEGGAIAPKPDESPPSPQSAEQIIKELERGAGPAVRGGGARDVGARPAAASALQASPPQQLLREGTSIVNRRGKIARDSGGGWLFIFDADATGLADPPLTLMPCLLLERIEEYARRSGHNSPALLSGAIYAYGGRNYLLPTVFRIPQERRNLSP